METVPIGNGPKLNKIDGSAVVHTLISGIETEYAIKAQKDASVLPTKLLNISDSLEVIKEKSELNS